MPRPFVAVAGREFVHDLLQVGLHRQEGMSSTREQKDHLPESIAPGPRGDVVDSEIVVVRLDRTLHEIASN